ncbi:MAG: TetR family transcriptional regulator, partial [Microbacterium sp.]|nr:TetR family transcriptional regulator [Microbacterium sp.]
RRVCGAVIDDLTEAGELARDLDPHLESQRLHALLDGLALHLVWTSSRDAAVEAEQVLSRHLDSLAG